MALPDPPKTFPPPVPPSEQHNHAPVTTPPTASSVPSRASIASPPHDQSNPTLTDGLSTIRPYDLTGVHLRPCARESLLTGIGSGFAIGGLRFVFGAKQHKAMNWAVGTFCLASMGAYAFCSEKRRLEKQAIDRAKIIMDRKQKEKMEEMERKKVERRALTEEREKNKGWWFGWGGK